MLQKYKVYCGSSTLWITNEIPDASIEITRNMDDAHFSVKEAWWEIQDKGRRECWLTKDVPKAWARFQSIFRLIHAAGGRVVNEEEEVLFIYRREKWDLAKGKVDKGETLEEAALREVREECGLTDLHLKSFLIATYHVYELKNKWVLKSTFWYQMSATKHQSLIPQLEEDITDMRWMSSQENDWRENTFPSIEAVLDA